MLRVNLRVRLRLAVFQITVVCIVDWNAVGLFRSRLVNSYIRRCTTNLQLYTPTTRRLIAVSAVLAIYTSVGADFLVSHVVYFIIHCGP